MPDMLFALPVRIEICRRNPRRLIVVSATGQVLLRTLSRSLRDQDIAEHLARAMNEWSANHSFGPVAMESFRFGRGSLNSVPGGSG